MKKFSNFWNCQIMITSFSIFLKSMSILLMSYFIFMHVFLNSLMKKILFLFMIDVDLIRFRFMINCFRKFLLNFFVSSNCRIKLFKKSWICCFERDSKFFCTMSKKSFVRLWLKIFLRLKTRNVITIKCNNVVFQY